MFADYGLHFEVKAEMFSHPMMSLASWYDSIPFHFRIFSISAPTLTYHDARNQRDASCKRAQCSIFVKSLLLATPLFGNV